MACTVSDELFHKPRTYERTTRHDSSEELQGSVIEKGGINVKVGSTTQNPTGREYKRRMWKKAAIIKEARAEVIEVMI